MEKVSVLIPARHEIYLQETIDDVLKKAAGEIEIIVVLDGYWPNPIIKDDKRVTLVHRARKGMRDSINDAVRIAKGKWLMKIDAHCMISPGFDEILLKDIDDNWIVVPRRYSLDAENWQVKNHKPWTDYEYLAWPYNYKFMKSGRRGMHAMPWDARTDERVNILFDEQMAFQGSCWVMSKEHFVKRIGWLKPQLYRQFSGEAQELGLTTQLTGGKIMLNKRVWYAHLWKGHGYSKKCQEVFGQPHTRQGYKDSRIGPQFVVDHWLTQCKTLDKLIDRFMPVPGWPDDPAKWREVPEGYNK